MDPLCVSLIQQYLDSTNSSLAAEFKKKYEPEKTNVHLTETLSTWREQELSRSLVFQHLKTVAPSLADEFNVKYQPRKTKVQLNEVLSKWKEEQIARSFVYKHLKEVAPFIAAEFHKKYLFRHKYSFRPKTLNESILRSLPSPSPGEIGISDKGSVPLLERSNKNTYTADEIQRLKRAIAEKENVRSVAIEMGRSYSSISQKMCILSKSVSRKGRFSAEEIERLKSAITKKEDYKKVAEEMRRTSESVRSKMLSMDQDQRKQQKKSFSLQEDLLILDKIVLCLRDHKLSSAGLLSPSVTKKLAKETGRNCSTVRYRWESIVQPWLLQHYTGTTGLRIELALANLVAQNYSDRKGIDWSEIASQHKEFSGQSGASLSQIFHKILFHAQRGKAKFLSLQDVADFAAITYQPGTKREPPGKAKHREAIISYFKKLAAELKINVML